MDNNPPIRPPTLRQMQEYAGGESVISVAEPGEERMPVGRQSEWMLRMIAEYFSRMSDALELYRPLPGAAGFHESPVRKRLLRGSNRAGKTAASAAEIARIVRGRDPFAERKGVPKRDGKLLCVGADASHLAQTMWKKLSWPGAFYCIPDEKTGELRAVRPHPTEPRRLDDYDERQRPVHLGGTCKKSKWRPAPPFIPPDAIAEIAYEKKNLDQVKRVLLTSGWEMLWHTSEGNLRKGIDLNGAWFDEDIKSPRWFDETFARLIDRDGFWIWSFTPEESTPEALHYHQIAERQPETIAEFLLLLDDNPFLTQKAKRDFYNMLSDDMRGVKYYGEYAVNARKVYSTFDPEGVHGVKPFEIPSDWMRVAAHDPGSTRLGTLLCAVNPEATELHAYDEVFLRHSDAYVLAEKLAPKVKPYRWHAHIIDYHAGRQTPFGMAKRVKEHYEDMFIKVWGLDELNMAWGCDDVKAREEAVRSLLRIDGDGRVKLRVHTENVPNFCQQMGQQFYKLNQPDKREDRSVSELVDDMEYIAAFFSRGLFYEAPEKVEASDPTKKALLALRAKQKRQKLQGQRAVALSVWESEASNWL